MKLVRVRVQNYRSVVDSGDVDIEEGVTVLIGKNEQGKTNFLKAIASFNEKERYTPGDLPNHLRPSLEEKKPEEIPVVTLSFALSSQDRKDLAPFISNGDSAMELKCTRFYGNNYQYSVIKTDKTEELVKLAPPDISDAVTLIIDIALKLKTQLDSHVQRLASFAPYAATVSQITDGLTKADFSELAQIDNVIRTYSTALKGLPGQDATIQEDITQATRQIELQRAAMQQKLQTDPARALRGLLPLFVLHITKTDQIPNDVKIADFVQNPDGTSRGMANLCRAAGLSMQKIVELANTTDTSHREAYEDHYKGTVSGGLNEFWTQETYHVHFRIEKEKLSVSISDETYGPRIAPSDRSDGFQWYLSFYSRLLNDMGVSNQTILLLDNPGLELHVDGQRDIKRFLEKKIARNSQVIYVTHSPAMINTYNLRQLRKVEMRPNFRGTKLLNYVPSEGEGGVDLLEPVRSAIGASLVASLMFNEWNVLVEGAADKPILEGAFAAFHRDRHEKILVNGSVSETKDYFLPKFYVRAGLPLVVFLDADNGGRRIHAALATIQIGDDKIVRLESVITGREGTDFELEDVLSADFYHKAVRETYPTLDVEMPPSSNRKCTARYEELFRDRYKIGFNKRRVAETVKELLERGDFDGDTKASLEGITSEILGKLQAQGTIASSHITETQEGNNR